MKTSRKKADKKDRLRKRRLVMLAIGVSLLLALAFGCVWAYTQKERIHRAQNAGESIRKVLDSHHFNKTTTVVDRWWYQDRLEKDMNTYALLQHQMQRMQGLVQKFRDVSTETRAIADRFREILPAVVINGTPFLLRQTNTPAEESHTNFMVVCFVSKVDAEKYHIYMPMWVTHEGFVYLPTIELSDKLFVSVLFHELGHAKRHNKVDGDGKIETNREVVISEEVEMHELGGKVLNVTSGGKYHQLLDEISGRFKSATSFEQAMAMISREDCLALDNMFDCAGSDLPSNILLTQAVMEIGFRYCDARRLGQKKKSEVYKWMDIHVFTPEIRK